MTLFGILLLALGLSTDAFAASLARGASGPPRTFATTVRPALIFGGAEGLMFLAGWVLGGASARMIMAFDHWIALILLLIIGGRMAWNGFHEDATGEADAAPVRRPTVRGTVFTAIGTSIDSAAVGIAMGLSGAPVYAALIIGATSFLASASGFRLGPVVGRRLGGAAEIVGGAILIAIGIRIFLDHTVWAV